jgi:hypothetical protein
MKWLISVVRLMGVGGGLIALCGLVFPAAGFSIPVIAAAVLALLLLIEIFIIFGQLFTG